MKSSLSYLAEATCSRAIDTFITQYDGNVGETTWAVRDLSNAHFSRHENSNCDRGIVKAAKSDYGNMHCVYTFLHTIKRFLLSQSIPTEIYFVNTERFSVGYT
jgi:hypothetical protein